MRSKKRFLLSQAIELRKRGYSYGEIRKELGVAKSTVQKWTSDIALAPGALDRLRAKREMVTSRWIAGSVRRRQERDDLLKSYVAIELEQIKLDRNLCRLLCAFLYWAEGTKSDTGTIRFTNSDPLMIKAFLTLFRNGFDLEEPKFSATIHLHHYHDQQKQVQFWSKVTGIGPEKIRIYLKPNSGKIIREDYPGCVRVSYGNVLIFQQIKFYYQLFSAIYLGA